ncbi:hypothetical protein DFP72DRAFT_1069018 [Ephemerocybe angulata]|uniref:Uncharacterized protein n=1 Tax=Ephemerocybe angulata TaxID=980116 RepID=A0A8H6M349_9AGAR|nr:hypothetical protein DFP72DRAFT_1069018 [Tulosesus angulatus]
MRLLHVIETTPSPEAICALSPSVDSPYLVYPSTVPSASCPSAPFPHLRPPSSSLVSSQELELASYLVPTPPSVARAAQA